MRDNFYHWLAVALLFSMFFAAAVARESMGHGDLFLTVAYAGIGILATIATIGHYKKKG